MHLNLAKHNHVRIMPSVLSEEYLYHVLNTFTVPTYFYYSMLSKFTHRCQCFFTEIWQSSFSEQLVWTNVYMQNCFSKQIVLEFGTQITLYDQTWNKWQSWRSRIADNSADCWKFCILRTILQIAEILHIFPSPVCFIGIMW